MLIRKVIAQHERGLVLKDKRIERVLESGVHWLWMVRAEIVIVSISAARIDNQFVDALLDSELEQDVELRERYFQVVELGEYDVAVVFQRNALKEVLKGGSRYVFWKAVPDLEIKVIDTKADIRVADDLARIVARKPALSGIAELIYPYEIQAKSLGLLWVDGELIDTLSAGLHAFWKVNRGVRVEQIELRLQSIEVAGQEILTKDKVSLRINLSAGYEFSDAVRARLSVTDYQDYLYRQLQFALREAVGTKTLDQLLADKTALNSELFRQVAGKLAEYGIKIVSIGVKDIILPGEMKDILNHVVQTEKAAQANVIKRREETAATRSLLNTAKLMESNPTLLRLKELETLEKVVDKVDKLTVVNGLNGLLQDSVKLDI